MIFNGHFKSIRCFKNLATKLNKGKHAVVWAIAIKNNFIQILIESPIYQFKIIGNSFTFTL